MLKENDLKKGHLYKIISNTKKDFFELGIFLRKKLLILGIIMNFSF